MTPIRRFLRFLPLIIVCAILIAPVAAHAVDPSTVDFVVKMLPANLQGWAMIAWAFAFYVVGPILKRFPTNTIASKVGEYVTQDTPRPPVAPGDAG
jgi:hypothetical protein